MNGLKRLAAVAALVPMTMASGCKCGRDRPYVPYSIDEGGALSSADDAGAAATTEPIGADAGLSFAEQAALVAPPNVSQWTVEGITLAAPAEMAFVSAVVRDFDGDGAKDALAVVRGAAAAEKAGIVYYKGAPGNAPPVATNVGPPIALGLGTCPGGDAAAPPAKQRLGTIGPHSLVVELSNRCSPRWFGVVSVAAPARILFSTTITDPPSAPALTVEADGSDRDHDGIDDVTLRVTLEGGSPPFEPGPKVSALLRWFDRPAGMSHDTAEPDASLRAVAGGLASRASRVKDAPAVPIAVRQLRALYGALCTEGGSPRVARVSCGASKALEEAGLAEVRAYTVMGDVLRSIQALDRAQKPPATKTAARTNDAQGWITQAAPVLSNANMRAIAAVPQIERSKSPGWAALAFEPSGKLLVRTLAGVVRVDPSLGDEADAGDVRTWSSHVVSPDGAQRLIEAYSACDGVALHLTFAPTSDGDMHDVALPVAPAFSARCTTAKGEPAPVIPIAWDKGGLEAIVAGEPILVSPDFARASALSTPLDQPGPQGSPRSPNGKTMVAPTPQGLVVRGNKTRLFRAKELDGGYGELRDCTVSDDGSRVACVRGGRAFVGIWEVPPL
jgi:hypothetical protein